VTNLGISVDMVTIWNTLPGCNSKRKRLWTHVQNVIGDYTMSSLLKKRRMDLCPSLHKSQSTENLRVAESSEITRCFDLAAFFGAAYTGLLSISPRLLVGDFSQPLICTSALQVVEIRGSPLQLTLSRSSQSVL
jgi:hypothetical protein